MSRLCFPALLIPLLLLGAALPVRAELQIEIIKPNEQAPQIGVTPFAEGNDLSTIIQNDLRRSGRFASSASLPQTVYRSADLDPGLWQQAQIPYAVVGRVTPQGDDLLIQYELMDVNKSQRLLGEQLTVSKARQREAAHLIADKIYQALTGVAGDFSGRIAYVLREKPRPAAAGAVAKPHFTLQIADTDGHEPRTVLESSEPILSPAWTPDGKSIAYVSFESGRPAIYLQALETGQRQVLAQFKGLNGAPSFSPDGQSMLFTASMDGNPEIYRMDLSSKKLERLTRDTAIDTEARYAADGKSFVFTSDRGGNPQVYRYTFADGSIRRLTYRGSFNARASLSPDNQSMVLVHRPAGQQFQVTLQDLRSGVTVPLTPTPLDESPSFSPNGQMIVYATREEGRGLLAIVSTDGRFRMRLPSENGEVREPAWAPRPR
jgi:TolB protein